MESLLRPFHRRKLSNATGKKAYDDVFSGHRPKFDGALSPGVKADEYREIFSSGQAVSSIPVLDLSNLDESSDCVTTKPDYGKIFGGFRDLDIAVSYEELVTRDKIRAPSSTSQSSQDLGDESSQSSDALKQFKMLYNKINQRSKNGLDGTTHVTQLHAVPGFTCFIDESASQPKKETVKQCSSVTNNVHPSVNSNKPDFPEKQTSRSDVESRSKHHQDESLYNNDTNINTFDLKSHPSKISSSSSAASHSKKETEKQNSLSDDGNFNTFQTDLKTYPPKVSLPPAASITNLDNHKDYQKKSTVINTEPFKSEIPPPPVYFDEEVDVNSAAAALRKAIQKAQESIRIAKESVGRKKEGLRGFSSKSFKDSLKVKSRVANVNAEKEQIEKDDKMKASQVVFPDFADGDKLFGVKKVINEINEKISESVQNSEIPLRSSFELRDNKVDCNSKEVGETEAEDPGSSGKYEYATRSFESIENSSYEASQEDNQRPIGLLVFESLEKKVEDTEEKIKNENKEDLRSSNASKLDEGLNNLTMYERVEDVKKISQGSDENGYEKRFNEVLGLLENKKQEQDEKVVEDDTCEKFYDVCEVEMIENAQNVSPKQDCEMKERENHEPEEIWKHQFFEKSSSDYDDAEENESVHSASHILIDTQEIDDISNSSEFQVEEDIEEKEIFENISADQTISKDENEREAKTDDYLSNHGLNDARSESSSSDTIHCMEIEVKKYNEKQETTVSENEEETETPEIGIKTETPETEIKTETEPKDEVVEKEQIKRIKEATAEERERERIKLAVERAIHEARERAFMEACERAEWAAVEKAKASDKTSAQSKLRTERAAVERATAEARQRALLKAMSQKKTSEPKIQVSEIKQTSSSVTHTNDELALRSKANLEKHNMIMERAAIALAEKEKRDLLVLKEQAERSRLAENVDADIKRWSNGKEGNLRALLSTLQYILGAESGWQAVSLTEIITASAVKKAYRKATLCVHPDKLQQRGASIQQKYICEKVFDLLKAAWNRFNSEER